MFSLDSCVNTHNPAGAINRQQHAVLENGRPADSPHYAWDTILSGNNGAVTEDATGIRNHGTHGREEGCPGRHRHLTNEDISGLDFTGLGQVVDDHRAAMVTTPFSAIMA